MINPIQLGDIDITQDVFRVISISPMQEVFQTQEMTLKQRSFQQTRQE